MHAVSDQVLSDLLSRARLIAAVGVSGDPGRPSYRVAAYQQSQGYKVIPVNPEEDSILGHGTVARLEEIQEPIDIVNVFAHGAAVEEAADAAIRAGAKALWLQPGSGHPAAEQRARAAGLTVVSERCFEAEHRRLLTDRPM